MDPTSHPKQSVVNIASGRVGPESVNVWNFVKNKNGETLKEKYEASLPDGFHNPISSSLVTMNIINRKVKIEERISFDTDLIYNRMMRLRGSREISTKCMFSFELAPVPTSMFDDDGEMKICKNKSSLKKSLKVETPIRAAGLPEVVILDGCAILWHINWPSGAVLHYCKAVSATVQQKLAISDVFLIFDRYYDFSIKSGTRLFRGKKASRRHLLQLSSPLPPKDAVLNVYQNKVQLIELICQTVIEDCIQLKTSRMLVATRSDDTPVEIYNGNLSLRNDLKTAQEEADVIMVQQMLVLAFAGASRIRVVSDDTDVFILLLHFYHAYQLSCNLSMESTTIGSRTVIDIGSTVNQHQDIMKGLLACHALSGCDTVAKFTGIGKATALKVLKSHNFPLLTIGNPDAAFGEVVEEATAFVAACYGIKDICFGSMSDVRYHVWSVKVGKKTTASPKLQVLPPTTESFMENVKRAPL